MEILSFLLKINFFWFSEFDFPFELQGSLKASRRQVATEHTEMELLDFLKFSATEANFRRFQEEALERYNDETKHIDLANNEREAQEFVSSHKEAYCVAKRKNPSLTCIDFFNIEQGKQRKNCGYRLIKALKQRARSIS